MNTQTEFPVLTFDEIRAHERRAHEMRAAECARLVRVAFARLRAALHMGGQHGATAAN